MDEWLNGLFYVVWVLSMIWSIWSYRIGFKKGVTVGRIRERMQWVAMKKDEGEEHK